MKSNRYVYPTRPFKSPKNKTFREVITEKRIVAFDAIASAFVKASKLSSKAQGKTTEEKILGIFLDNDVLFGPRAFVKDHSSEWIRKFTYFTEKKRPLQFAVLGFPFKMAVPLKTNRTLPDMGEVLSLARLDALARMIGKIYKPGAIITIFTEGAFGPFVGIDLKTADAYDAALRRIIQKLGIGKRIKVRKLGEMESNPRFENLFAENTSEFEALLRQDDTATKEKAHAISEPFLKIVRSTTYPEGILLDAYDTTRSINELDENARNVRKALEQHAAEATPLYFSYLKTRDDLNFLSEAIPGYLALSVSPKPGRLGIFPVKKEITTLPYHGVPVWDTKKKQWSIEYLGDIRRSKDNYRAIHLKGDTDNTPFFYERLGR